MKITKILFLLFACSMSVATAFCQDQFTNCTAAYLDGKLIVDDYGPNGHCEIARSARGELTVQTMNDLLPTGKIKFKVARRDGKTKTLLSFSDQAYQSVEVATLLANCQVGDAIVLLTLDDRYALPHNELLVK